MRKHKRRSTLDAPEALEEVLGRAGEDRFAKRRSPISVRAWREAVGPRIADRARPVALERGVLVVKVATSVWANELSMLAPDLVRRLNERGHAVESLRFKVGALEREERPPERRTFRKIPAPRPLAPELSAVVAKIPDDELRGVIEQAARANLAWQENVTEAPRGARGPRGAGTGSARPDRSAEGSGAASRRSSGGGGGRPR